MTDSPTWSAATGPPPERPAQIGNVKATRDDWLDLALSVLAAEGVAHVTVLNLSERLGVSRSSFYWYFKNRDELLDALLDRWDRLNTRSIVDQADRPAATVNEAVCNVFRCWVNPAIFSPRLDFAVREWARRSSTVRKALDRSDRVRTQALKACSSGSAMRTRTRWCGRGCSITCRSAITRSTSRSRSRRGST